MVAQFFGGSDAHAIEESPGPAGANLSVRCHGASGPATLPPHPPFDRDRGSQAQPIGGTHHRKHSRRQSHRAASFVSKGTDPAVSRRGKTVRPRSGPNPRPRQRRVGGKGSVGNFG